MEGMGVKFTLVIETSINVIQACLGVCLALLGPKACPNSRNGDFNLPPTSHPPPPPAPPPNAHPLPIIYYQRYYSGFETS